MRHSIYNSFDTGAAGRGYEGLSITGTNTYYGDAMTNSNGSGCALHLDWSGTPTGTFTFWVSDKPIPGLLDDTDWVQDSTNFTASNPAGSASKSQHNVAHRHLWYRLKYVNSSGSGTLKGYAQATQ